MRFTSALLLLASAALRQVRAVGDDAWHLDYLSVLVNEELDPIVSPNAQSSHMHKVSGGNNFGAAYNFATQEASSCTTSGITADSSNYWMPALYWIVDPANPTTTTFVPLVAHLRVYYFLARNDAYTPVSAFPDGLRILVGDPTAKVGSIYATFTCQINVDFTDSILQDNFNFDRDCPYGMKTEVYFPGCWDGINLYKSDNSHMSYPAGGTNRDGACPWSHPIRIPSLMLEYTWDTADYLPGTALSGNLAWANGDTTGYAVHADFINGWNRDVFLTALADPACVGINTSIPMDACPSLGKYLDLTAQAACTTPANGVLEETFGNADLVAISRLPGCNPIWGDTATKPTCDPAIAGLDVSAQLGTDGSLVAVTDQQQLLPLPTTPGWQYVDCFSSSTAFLSNPVQYYDTALTVDSCTANCLASGFNYASMGFLGTTADCICSDGILDTAPITPGLCLTACPGNSTQMCGGSYVFSTYFAPPGTTTVAASSMGDLGCYANPTVAANGLIGAATYEYASYSMTTELCLQACVNRNATWAALNGGIRCYCGTDLAGSMGTGLFQPETHCTIKCGGNSSEICGDNYYSNVYNLSTTSVVSTVGSAAAGYQGCWADSTSARVLSGTSWSISTNTRETCANGCSELGYTYSGTEYGTQCFCGNTLPTSASLPLTSCNMACAGNSTETCGQSGIIEVFSTSIATSTAATQAAAHPTGWLGCYIDDGSSVLTTYSYTSTVMTVELCKSACAGFGYTYGGVEAGNTCKCGSTMPTTVKMPHTYCSTACKGNATETCGATGYIDVYNASTVAVAASTYVAALGCYSDPSPHGLTGYSFTSTAMTNALCMQSCKEIGYAYAGTEGGNTCYCGSSWTSTSVLPSTSCSTACSGNSSSTCGGSSIISLLNATFGANIPTQPTGFQGCYVDQASPRALAAYTYSAATMTASVCRQACANLGYSLAGTESGTQCFCDNALASVSTRVPYQMCTSACGGNSTELCGGSYKIDVYSTAGASVSLAASNGTMGCYSDYATLNSFTYTSTFMTPQVCSRACSLRSYAYSGTVNGNTCRCGNTAPTSLQASTSCATACAANAGSICGGTNMMSTVQIATANLASSQFDVTPVNSTGYVGCYTEGTTRTLPFTDYSATSNTAATCQESCSLLGYAYSGAEYGVQCWCATSLNATSGAYRVADSECSMACPGGGSATCGASNRLSAYATSYATTAATSASTTSTAEGYTGCYAAGTYATSAVYSFTNIEVSASLCRRICRNKGYASAGTMAGNQCYCGATADLGNIQPVSLCSTACSGNSTQACGSSTLVSIYNTYGAGSLPPAGYPTGYVGCFQDYASPRDFTGYSYTSSAMSSALCGRVCVAQGFTIYGTQNGNGCFCSATTTGYPTLQIQDSDCSVTCSGLATEKCGYSYRLSVYDTNFNGASVAPVVNTTTSTSAKVSTAVTTAKTSTTAVTTAKTTVASTSKASTAITSAKTSSVAASTAKVSVSAAVTTAKTSSVAASSVKVSTTSTSSTSAATSKATSAAGWTFLGCYTDGSIRTLSVSLGSSALMTPSLCETNCAAKGYSYAGVEYANQCYCSNTMSTTLVVASSAKCNMVCAGDATLDCGASYYIDVYQYTAGVTTSSSAVATSTSKASTTVSASSTSTSKAASSTSKAATATSSSAVASSTSKASTTVSGSSTSTSKAASSTSTSKAASSTSKAATTTSTSAAAAATTSVTPATVSSVAYGTQTYKYGGCIADGSARSMNSTYQSSLTMTVESCATHCGGQKLFGMESGGQCYCATTLAYNTTEAAGACDTVCAGNSSEICGGNYRISLYVLDVPVVAASTSTSKASTTSKATSTSTTSKASSTSTTSKAATTSVSSAKASVATAQLLVSASAKSTVASTSASASESECATGSVVTVTKTVTAGSTASTAAARKRSTYRSRHNEVAAKRAQDWLVERSEENLGGFTKYTAAEAEPVAEKKKRTTGVRSHIRRAI